MKKIIFLIFIILSLRTAVAQDLSYFNSESLEINVTISSDVTIIPESEDYHIKILNINLSYVPIKDKNQKILFFKSVPNAQINENALSFNFENPEAGKKNFMYNAYVKTYSTQSRIKEKIPFPLKEIPDQYKAYLKSGEIIDSDNKEIIKLSSTLVEGDDDLYSAVDKLASWTKSNINYNLSTLTVQVSQKASWVLENKQGVCDEMTSLFIALLRAVGIPAKFISGISYTNSPEFIEGWGPHGWAEVYFPGIGFVPFDVTYGEFGYVDATHIKLKESFDSNEPSTKYRMLGKNVNLETMDLDINANLLNKEGAIQPNSIIKPYSLKENVGFGSRNAIIAEIENLNDYYISFDVSLSKTEEIQISDSKIKHLMLKPKEKKTIYWILRVDENLKDDFIYTFPFYIYVLGDISANSSFKASSKEIVYSLEQILNLLQQKNEEERKTYSRNVDFQCSITNEEFYLYENATIACEIKNTGNTFLKDLEVCYKNCIQLDLGIGRAEKILFKVLESAGKKDLTIRAKNDYISKTSSLKFNVLDLPLLQISDIKKPSNVTFNENFQINFNLNKISKSSPINVNVDFIINNAKKSWSLAELSQNKEFVINLDGKSLKNGKNNFKLDIYYEDKNGMEFKESAVFSISLINLTLMQKIKLLYYQLQYYVENMKLQSMAIIILSAMVLFIGILHYSFRKKTK